MSFEFQSTLVNITPSYRISGANVGGISIEMNGDIKVARIVVTNDADVKFALTGPYVYGDPDAIYTALSAELFELAPGILVNEGAISSVDLTAESIVIDLEGAELKYAFMPDAAVTEPTLVSSQTWKLTTAGFAALSTAASTWRSSMDGTLEGLSVAITTEVADRIAAITAEEQRVDALIASGMWLFATQADFPAAADNHGRVVHSHADGAIFYAHGGMWHQVAKEVDLQSTIASVANEAAAREAADNTLQANIDAEAATRSSDDAAETLARTNADSALSGRLDVLEADPTTATAVAAGDAATLSSANTYTDTAITTLTGTAPAVLDTLGEIADAINDDANVYTTLVTQISAVQADVDGNEADGDAADAALSGRLDTLEADPTTATAVAAVQSDVDQNESDSDAADAALSARLDVLEADPTTATALAAVQGDVDQNETDSDAADAALSGRLDVLEADPTTATAVAAVQSDVDQNEADSDAADAALSGRLDTLEADPTTATAVAAVQSDVDQNEADSDAADAALSGRLDVLEADPTTATAVAAVQSDVDQNEADADAALALKAPLADPDFTGQLEVDTNARLEFDSNLTKLSNVLRGTSIVIGNNITLNPAAADGRVEIEGEFYLRPSDLTNAADDTAAAAAGVIVGQVYRNGSQLMVRVS